jgi:phosphatidate cytidylyltransferase
MNNQPNGLINDIGPEYKASLRSRLIVGAILVGLLAPAIILGSWPFLAAVVCFLAIAVLEVIMAPHKHFGWWVYAVTYAIVYSYVFWFIIKDNAGVFLSSHETFSLEVNYSQLDVSVIGIAIALFLYFLIGIFDSNFSFGDMAYFFTFTLILGLGFQSFFFLRYHPFFLVSSPHSPYNSFIWVDGLSGSALTSDGLFKYLVSAELLLYTAFGATMNDTFAYFGGTFFGRHKLNPRVSPHKTWGGFWWGFGFAAVINLAIGLTLAVIGFPILPSLTLDKWYWVVLLSLAIPLFGDLGDLSLSFIKRFFGIKDYGNILKGHGGILDRLGSDMFAAIGVTILLVFINNSWNIFK